MTRPVLTAATTILAALAGIAVWAVTTPPAETAVLAKPDPGIAACRDLLEDDLLALFHDDYSAWGTDVYHLAGAATESRDAGIATAATDIVDYVGDDGRFTPVTLSTMVDDLAAACVTAGFVTDGQLADARERGQD